MKINYKTKKYLIKMIYVAIITILLMLSGCAGRNADPDMLRSSSSGTIDCEEEITALELYKLLTDYFGEVVIKLSDSKYLLPDNSKVAQLSHIKHNKDWDCDDYVIAALVPLRNYAFGAMFIITASGYRHAVNIFINHDKEIFFWEPQTNQYYAGQFYKPELIFF